jgi:hypothetical protein
MKARNPLIVITLSYTNARGAPRQVGERPDPISRRWSSSRPG